MNGIKYPLPTLVEKYKGSPLDLFPRQMKCKERQDKRKKPNLTKTRCFLSDHFIASEVEDQTKTDCDTTLTVSGNPIRARGGDLGLLHVRKFILNIYDGEDDGDFERVGEL